MGTINLSWTIDDAVITRIHDAVSYENGYEDEIESDGSIIPNPVSRADFFAERMKLYMLDMLKRYEGKKESNTAINTKHTEIDGIVIT